MLKLIVSKEAGKFVKKLLPKHQRQLALKIVALTEHGIDVQDSQHLKGSSYKRVDVGEYRIIYTIIDMTLFIVLIGKRNDNDVYKKMIRKTR